MDSKRIGTIHETIMYVPNTVPDSVVTGGTLDVINDYKLLTANQYTRYVDKGVFVYDIPCNRRKVITDDSGNEVVVSNDSNDGVFTEFSGFFTFTFGDDSELPINRVDEYKGHVPDERRFSFKVPQQTTLNAINGVSIPSIDDVTYKSENDDWRRQLMTFQAGQFYSVARFHGTSNSDDNSGEGFTPDNWVNNSIHYFMGGHIFTNSVTGATSGGTHLQSVFQLQSNDFAAYDGVTPIFGYEWLNFCLYFPQYTFYNGAFSDAGRSKLLNADNRQIGPSTDNNILIGGTLKNTVNMARSDIHPTKFINVPKTDILKIVSYTEQGVGQLGFRNGFDYPYDNDPLTGSDYASSYFYKGLGSAADIFAYLRRKNIV